MTAISYPLAEHTLANGLRVIVSEDHTVPNVGVSDRHGSVRFNVGCPGRS